MARPVERRQPNACRLVPTPFEVLVERQGQEPTVRRTPRGVWPGVVPWWHIGVGHGAEPSITLGCGLCLRGAVVAYGNGTMNDPC